jgi:hypothetical protein
MQVDLDPAELEKTKSASHEVANLRRILPARLFLERGRRRRLLRNKQAHRQHVGFEEAVPLEEVFCFAKLMAYSRSWDP